MKRTSLASTSFVLAAIIFMASSCRKTEDILLPASSGRPYEVMVVCTDVVWQGIAGRALHKALDVDIPGLPQPESSFRISHITPSQLNQITEIFRNIIIININSDIYSTTKVHFKKNVYSSSQIIMHIDTPSEEDMALSMQHMGLKIVDFFNDVEFRREVSLLKERHSVKIAEDIKKKFGVNILLPSEVTYSKHGKNFMWVSNNTATAMKNFCIYTYHYRGGDILNRSSFIRMRDSILKTNIPGEEPNMYMHTNNQTVSTRLRKIGDRTYFEARGLWEMENDCMGGPFVSHSTIDTTNHRVVVVEGFVYAPESKKRTLIRAIEGALYTFQLPRTNNKELFKQNNTSYGRK